MLNTETAQLNTNSAAKKNLLPLLPGDHGAYAMLLVPAVIGALVGLMQVNRFEFLPLALLFLALLGGFFAYEPLDALTKKGINPALRERAQFWLAIYLGVTFIAGFCLVFGWGLLWLPGIAVLEAIPLVIYFLAKHERKQRGLPVRMATIAGLVLSAPTAYYVVANRFDWLACGLWLISLAYFGSTLFYVHSWFEAKKRLKVGLSLVPAWLLQITLLYIILNSDALLSLVLLGQLPFTIGLAYLPLLVKLGMAFRRPPINLSIKQVGLFEFSQSFVFALLVVLALR